MSEKRDKTCGSCARWKVPDSGCPYARDIAEGTIRKSDHGCDSYFERSKSKEKSVKKVFKDSGLLENGCFEAVYVDGKARFLVNNDGNFNIVETVQIDEETICPKESKAIPYEPYGVYEGDIPSREEIYRRIRSEFDFFVDVEPIWKDVQATSVLLTYHQEKLRTVPYLYPYGDNESGKTTILNIMAALCYRPMFGVTIPSADLYGYLEDSNSVGCVFEDEVQGIWKDTDKIKIYKSGYKTGAVVPRTLITQNSREIKYYRTFCFKVCAAEQIAQVKGFRERFIEIPMVEGFPQKEWTDLTREDVERIHNLRNMLLKCRMLTRTWELPQLDLPIKGRLKELWKPILQTASGLPVYDTLFRFVDDQRAERLNARQNTLEGRIVKVVLDRYADAEKVLEHLSFQNIWTDLKEDLDGKIDERKPHVMSTSEFFDVTKNKVGYRLREILSGKSIVWKDKVGDEWVSVKGYVFDYEKVKRVAKKYGFPFSIKLLSAPSSRSAQASESMDKDSPKNVEKEPYAPQKLGILGNTVESPDLLIPCPVCKAAGKNLQFANDSDLSFHMFSCHDQPCESDYVR